MCNRSRSRLAIGMAVLTNVEDLAGCALVGEKIAPPLGHEVHYLPMWSGFVKGKGGFLYGIPAKNRRVIKFNPVDKSTELIGPEFVKIVDWHCGVLAKNGCIYCPPRSANTMIMLKINTIDNTVETIDLQLQRQITFHEGWGSGAVGRDGCIYYFPYFVDCRYILRVDPDTDKFSFISLPNLHHAGFVGTVLGKDGCIYGLPTYSTDCVVRFDPMEHENISYFGKYIGSVCELATDGVLGCDGNIYALNDNADVLKVDTSARTVSFIRNEDTSMFCGGNPVVGPDQCIYWLKGNGATVVFDPITQQPSSSTELDIYVNTSTSWSDGALADDGVIYFAPSHARQVLAFDPFRKFSRYIELFMELFPKHLGRIFMRYSEESLFDEAVRRFGFDKALGLLDECLPSDGEWGEMTLDGVPIFVLAASRGVGNDGIGGAPLDVIYRLVRRDVHGLFSD